MPSQTELRKQITQQIIDALEQDILPWRRPWMVSPNAGRPANLLSKRAYTGVNPLLLELHARQHGLGSRWWGTFNQWQQLGGTVQKRPAHVQQGEWGCRIIFYRPVTKTVTDADTGEEKEEHFPLMRSYSVFNADQVCGEEVERYRSDQTVVVAEAFPDFAPADELIAAIGADIRLVGDRACYVRPRPEDSWPEHHDGDYILMPPKDRFSPVGSFYETTLHELAHWSELRTGWNHAERGYALGELAAEIASCYLATELGIPHGEAMENHASYIRSWLDKMKGDPKFIFTASTQASKVTDCLLSFVESDKKPEPVGAVQAA